MTNYPTQPPGSRDESDPLPRPTDPDDATASQQDPDAEVVVSGMPAHEHRPRPGYHDPTYQIAGAAPARSALTLRLVLAAIGMLAFASGAILLTFVNEPVWESVVLALLAATALADLVVVARRKRQELN